MRDKARLGLLTVLLGALVWGCSGNGASGSGGGAAAQGGAGASGGGVATGAAGTAGGTVACDDPPAVTEHPRMLVTPWNIDDLRQAIATHYTTEYQQYADWAATMPDDDGNNILGEAGHDPLRALMVHQAFIGLVGELPGVNLPIAPSEYSQRAIARLQARLTAGDTIAYVAPLVYDWTFGQMSPEQRASIAQTLATRDLTSKVFSGYSVTQPDIAPVQLFSSKYYEAGYAFFAGLALQHDGYVDAAADAAVARFDQDMLSYGYLDAANFVAGRDGGWAEWIGYSSWHPRTHMLLVNAHRTARGENYLNHEGVVAGNALRFYPQLMHYMADPHRYYGTESTFIRLGGAETTDCSLQHRSLREQIYMLGRGLQESCLDQPAGLLRSFVDRYDVPFPSYEHGYVWPMLGTLRAIEPITPEAAGLPHAHWFRHLGAFAARSGFDAASDGVLVVTDGHYRFSGHNGVDDFPGFALARFGELANTRVVAHRGYGNLNDYDGAHQMSTVYFAGGHEVTIAPLDAPPDLEAADTGTGAQDHGGIEQVTSVEGVVYHARIDRSRLFTDGVQHSREYVWLPAADSGSGADYLVIYDRTHAPSAAEWVMHMPWKPAASGHDSSASLVFGSGLTGRIGDAYTGTDVLVTEHNGLGGPQDNAGGGQDYTAGAGAHGVLYARTLLPRPARVELTRVAQFDNDVLKRQHNLALKAHRWQVSVFDPAPATDQAFLLVLESGDDNVLTSPAATALLSTDTASDGVWIPARASQPAAAVVLAHAKGPALVSVQYTLPEAGPVRHVVVGVTPGPCTVFLPGGGASLAVNTATADLWSYPNASNPEAGVLSFESDVTTGAVSITCSGS